MEGGRERERGRETDRDRQCCERQLGGGGGIEGRGRVGGEGGYQKGRQRQLAREKRGGGWEGVTEGREKKRRKTGEGRKEDGDKGRVSDVKDRGGKREGGEGKGGGGQK